MKLPFLRNEKGVAAVEFALVAPVLVLLMVGIGTYGTRIIAYNKMRQAVSTGAEYVMTVSDDTTEVKNLVLSSWDDKPGDASVTVAQACTCAGVTNDCSTSCADGSYPLRYVTINATGTWNDLGGATKTLTASQQVRTR